MDSSPMVPPPSRSFSRDGSDASVPRTMKKFYKGEPLALGTTQILIGILQIAFGIVATLMHQYRNPYYAVMVPFWTGILYIISGSLSVAAAKNPKIPLVKGMLGMNVVTAVAAGIGIIFLSFSLDSYYPRWYASYKCRDGTPDEIEKCRKLELIPWNISAGITAIFLILNILEFCIAISTAAFGCKTTCRDSYTETVVVVYQNAPPVNPVNVPAVCKDPESP